MTTILKTDNNHISSIIAFDGNLLLSIEDACKVSDISLDYAISALICDNHEIRTLNGNKYTDEAGIKILKKTKHLFMRSGNPANNAIQLCSGMK
ncbi:MAG: hypothetical protein KKC46_13695 [Proteobacteria bacterium]|nr:hypothetical protein [Pseudomonadota bacterium]